MQLVINEEVITDHAHVEWTMTKYPGEWRHHVEWTMIKYPGDIM